MAVRVTQVHMQPGGSTHAHIERVKWENPSDGATGNNSVAEMIDFIDRENGKAYTWDGRHRAEVRVVRPSGGRPYIRTMADGVYTNNLLELPRF